MKDVYGPAHIDYGKFNPVKTSTYGENFYNKDGANFGKNMVDEARRMQRKTNFNYGLRSVKWIFIIEKVDKVTTQNADYQKRHGGGPPIIPENIMNDLKGDHTCIGIDK